MVSIPQTYSTSAERYFIPAKIPGFRTFLCNMATDLVGLNMVPRSSASSAGAGAGARVELKESKDLKINYPYGYVAYLFRSNGYNISSILPIQLNPLTGSGSFEIKDLNLSRLDKYIDNSIRDNNLIYPVSTVYFTEINKYSIICENNLINSIRTLPSRYVFINVSQNVFHQNKLYKGNIVFFMDKERKVIDRMYDTVLYSNDSKLDMKDMKLVPLASNIRQELITKLIPNVEREYKVGTTFLSEDKLSFEEKKNSNIIIDPSVNFWYLILLHHKILNPKLSFDEINTKVLDLITERKKEAVYSYYKKIIALSENLESDLTLLRVYS